MPSPMDMPRVRPVAVRPAPTRWTLTAHAYRRAVELGYTEAEVLLCAQEPATRYESTGAKYGVGEFVCKRGDIACVTRPADMVVVTVLLPKQEQWTHGKDRR